MVLLANKVLNSNKIDALIPYNTRYSRLTCVYLHFREYMCYQHTMINKNTYLSFLALICLISVLPTALQAQENIDTKSGQMLTVETDGTYTFRKEAAKDESTEAFMGVELNPFEDPNNNELSGDRQERTILRNLKTQLQQIEANSTVERYQQKVIKEALDGKIKVAKKEKKDILVESLKKQLEAAHVDYDVADMRANESYNLIKKLNEIKNVKPKDRAKTINALVLESSQKLGTTSETIKTTVKDYTFSVDARDPDYLAHDGACDITFNGIDKSLNQKKIEHAPQHLFGYTSEKLKHFLKNENFLNCNAYLTKLDGEYYLNLDLDLATKDASRNYGFIDKGDMIKLTFINGDNFIANSIFRAEGKLEPYSGHTKYEAVYQLQDIEMELIEDLELDKIAIIWSSGFEEYPVYEIDLLQRQLECLKKAE